MSDLTYIEKQKLEMELGMSGGYVLEFSNRTFEQFFREVVGIEIYDPRFGEGSGSKANRMRAFWKSASNAQLLKLFTGILERWEIYAKKPIPSSAKALLEHICQRIQGEKTTAATPAKPTGINEAIAKQLHAKLLLISSGDPQQRGFAFENFFKELFDAYGLAGRSSFRIIGEQIDGSFELHNEPYLLEARWRGAQAAAADLHTFEGKLREKATWARGLFVSQSGFSSEGLDAFGRGKRIICMDGYDLSEMLRLKLSFPEVLAAKVRRAAETGNPFTAVRDLFLR